MAKDNDIMKDIVALCKRRGLIYPGSEIYGGMANTWDYGPYGVLLKNNVKAAWWEDMVMKRPDIVGLDSGILMNPRVWEASGHVEEFTDPLVDCKECKKRFKGDDPALSLRAEAKQSLKCPECGGELTEAKQFNLMFKTNVGPVTGESETYLRPETAQGIFVNFKNVLDSTRVKLPFGIAQIGKAFRNEITPGNFIFRTLEFEQFELEYFVEPEGADKAFKEWTQARLDWYLDLGITKKNLRLQKHSKEDLAHYAKAVTDIEYNFPFGWAELEGIANRTDFDLKQHAEHSGESLEYTDDDGKKFVPYIIEPSGGVDRAVLAFLVDAYNVEQVSKSAPRLARDKAGQPLNRLGIKQVGGGEGEERVVLRLHPRLAPIKATILPLVRKEPLILKAKEIYHQLKEKYFVEYDESGTIGRRYRRQDEIGTPFCITVDFENLEKNQVTVRNRDSMKQELVKIGEIASWLQAKLKI